MRSMVAEGGRFLLVGGLLLGLDATIYATATLAGVANELANPMSRGLAAAAGYFAHRQLTFVAAAALQHTPAQVIRYGLVWVTLTLISTQTLAAVTAEGSATAAIFAKPLVEAVLAAISFLLLKRWVYRT